MKKFLLILAISILGCGPARNPLGRLAPSSDSIEYLDTFTLSEQRQIERAADFYRKAWDERFLLDPLFLPGPRIPVTCQVKRMAFNCPGSQSLVNGCAHPWAGRFEVAATEALSIPSYIHEQIHYQLPFPYDGDHKNPMWIEWNKWRDYLVERFIESEYLNEK